MTCFFHPPLPINAAEMLALPSQAVNYLTFASSRLHKSVEYETARAQGPKG
jgi:hypothetical protein